MKVTESYTLSLGAWVMIPIICALISFAARVGWHLAGWALR